MEITQLNSQIIRKAAALLEKKESYQALIAQIDRELEALFEDQPVQTAPRVTRAKSTRVTKRGNKKEAIIEMIKQAGRSGISIAEIREKLGISPSSFNSWMHTTGKKIKEIKKIGRGQYAWVG